MPARRAATTGDLPPAPTFPDDEAWTIGEPDLIVEIPKPHVVPANGPDLWIDYIADSGMTEDRYLKAVEAKPGPGRPRRRAPPAHLSDPGHRRGRGAGRPARRSADQQRELPERVRGRQERRHPARRHRQAGQGGLEDSLQPALPRVGHGDHRPGARRVEVLSQGLQAEVPPDLAADRQRARRARHPAQQLDPPRRLLPLLEAGAGHRGPGAHAQPRQADVRRGDPADRARRDAQLHVLRLQLAQGLQLRRRGDADPAGRHDAAHHPVARQHRQQPQQSRSAQLGRLRPAHDRRDGVLVGDVDLSRRRGLQDPARRTGQEPGVGSRQR